MLTQTRCNQAWIGHLTIAAEASQELEEQGVDLDPALMRMTAEHSRHAINEA